jgi:hypothetical protein
VYAAHTLLPSFLINTTPEGKLLMGDVFSPGYEQVKAERRFRWLKKDLLDLAVKMKSTDSRIDVVRRAQFELGDGLFHMVQHSATAAKPQAAVDPAEAAVRLSASDALELTWFTTHPMLHVHGTWN